MSIPRFALPCQISRKNYDLSLETQGTLVSVKLKSRTLRQSNRSVAYDRQKFLKAQFAARHLLVEAGENKQDDMSLVWKHIALNPEPHLLSLLTSTVVASWKNHVARRGAITQFSKKSRLRLLRMCARMDVGLFGLFMTFTYRQNMTDVKLAKSHLEKLCLWLRRHYPQTAFVWRMEFQARGAVHFHVIALNRAFIPAVELTKYWQKMTGDDSYPDVKKLRSRRKVMYYVSKYIAKVTQEATIEGDCVTGWEHEKVADYNGEYCEILSQREWESLQEMQPLGCEKSQDEALGLDSLPYSDNYIGRFWGVINRACLPYAPLRTITVRDDTGKIYFSLKRYARRYWKFLSRRIQSFSLFVNNPTRWEALLMNVLVS